MKNRVRELRKQNRLTVRQLAKAISVAPSTISRIEREKRKISLSQAYALGNFFGVPIVELLKINQTLPEARNGQAK